MTGLYCFTVIDKEDNSETIVYIGKTYRDFYERFEEHKFILQSESKKEPYNSIRHYLEEGNRVVMRSLLPLQNMSLSYGKQLTDYDLEMMEMAFITYFQPVLNNEGVRRNYGFTADEKLRAQKEEEFDFEKNKPIFICGYWTPGDWKPALNQKVEFEFTLKEDGDICEF